ncbi:MAG: hypothetical protein MUF71_09995 [Candidatus Kapabacteria bacterium]|nr:hypothetical protein [Candidatus Kapabacteria bacterium]
MLTSHDSLIETSPLAQTERAGGVSADDSASDLQYSARSKKQPSYADKWDETLMSEDSIALLALLGDEAEREYRAGKTHKGGWGD